LLEAQTVCAIFQRPVHVTINKAKVSAIFELEDKTLLKFTRIVSATSSEYRFNDEVNII
jgi:hypothetical protein